MLLPVNNVRSTNVSYDNYKVILFESGLIVSNGALLIDFENGDLFPI